MDNEHMVVRFCIYFSQQHDNSAIHPDSLCCFICADNNCVHRWYRESRLIELGGSKVYHNFCYYPGLYVASREKVSNEAFTLEV